MNQNEKNFFSINQNKQFEEKNLNKIQRNENKLNDELILLNQVQHLEKKFEN